MADKEQLKILKQGVSSWNNWTRENWKILRDLSGANLSGVNLGGADLGGVYLVGVDLSGANLMKANLIAADLGSADLRGANLREVKCSDTFFIGANLNGANLRDALIVFTSFQMASLQNAILINTDLSETSFVNANLSNADISGATINNINMSSWIIKGIRCTHVFRNGKRINYDNKEFEKRYTMFEKIIEVIIDVPYSDLTYYVGRIIQEAANEKYGEGSLVLKGETALSNTSTKFEFLSFLENEKFDKIYINLIEIREKINTVYGESISKQEDKDILKLKEKIALPGLPVEIDTKAVQNVLTDRFAKMSPILQKIVLAIQSSIR